MTGNEILTKELNNYCDKIGIDLVGFANPEFFDKYQSYNRPHMFLENVKSVIIIGLHLYDLILDAWNKDEIKNLNYHFADSILGNQCHRIKNYLEKKRFKSKIIPYKPGLFLKEVAALAGIGPIGKSNLLITEKHGSQVRLRALATEAPFLTGNPIYESKYCNECDNCVKACPANAFSEGKYNKDACLAYCLANLKKLSDNTALWCNICIECCPIGKD